MKDRTIIEAVENGRAAYAFEQVKEFVSGCNEDTKKEFRSYVKKMPTMIQVNGLGQALAFYYSKNNAYAAIYRIIDQWVRQHSQVKQIFTTGNLKEEREFIGAVVKLGSKDYKHVTMETLALLNWLRRFADGMVKEGK